MSEQKFRFHILPPQHTIPSPDFSACAYTNKSSRFSAAMKARGHTTIFYGHEDSRVNCSEFVPVLSKEDFNISYGDHDYRSKFFKFDLNDHAYQVFDRNAIAEVAKRKQKNDFILPFWGVGGKSISDAHPDMILVEPGIGYASGHWAKFRIYESHSIRSAIGGAEAVGMCHEDWYHAVIPNYFDPNDFTFSKEKDDYFLFLGRVYAGKGIDVAVQVCQAIGQKLIIAGQGSLAEAGYQESDLIKHVGYADPILRKSLMSKAKGFFLPSMYNEPFGGAAVESMFSGTPIITTDWGVFPSYNIHGVTGYRCRTFDQFCWAARNINKIDPQNCRDMAMNNFSMERVSLMYEEYFSMVWDVYNGGKGWYQLHPERENLDWLKTWYPPNSAN